MKRFSELLAATAVRTIITSADPEIGALSYDSRSVGRGDCFFAVRGESSDGHDFIDAAVKAGAAAVVCERLPEHTAEGVSYAVVDDSHGALADMAAAFYDNPSHELRLVGVTGTNGKTTVATLLCDMFRMLGHKAGLISTVVYRVGEREVAATHTTPDAVRLNAMMREMVDDGCEYCFMDKTFAEYVKAKKRLFDTLPREAFALVNADDRNGAVMVQNTRARVSTYSLRSMADFRCKVLEMHFDGMLLSIGGREVWVDFIGRFNAANLLAVYGAARLLGVGEDDALRCLSALHSVSGRFEPVRSASGRTVIVDYAHTPDALQNVIETINEIRRPEQQLIVVCGCGGDRDRTKRPEMGAIASREASVAVFTSDNPRTEDPEAILDQIMEGVAAGSRCLRITDRAQAIRTAVMLSHEGDIILIAGKGHETYQIVGRERHHFDDREQAAEALRLVEEVK